ncbi:16S rRNA (cytidine1402-2'-O)-methyltransferase [Thiothrix eikelboomii]|uniref:Ribosomal RNA small subunit methyltransferase I n=1 Tax=Thiothrix eikelboomii TaxID=92487 RepID=A0A1T4VXZ9_9GAMM|nr:16S rRNA (cytidine(1402)-2'-O)-methyltransferase [Thiothrix eikelboomii]SKA69688.1 16S rRNA (cytidine1402-2'-O)-methyltransferase [Thiothrix eikelboomii]
MKASLYCVATPIGNLADLTERAIKTLTMVDKIYAEDTRVSLRLLTHLGLQKPLVSLHDHNETARVAQVLTDLEQGLNLALVSDAGTPLISDPGYHLVKDVAAAGFRIIPIPGACAVVAALSAAGLATDRFIFEGFLSAKSAGRRASFTALKTEERTLIFYESSHRIAGFLEDLITVLGAERELVIARELTKLYESFYRGTAEALLARLQGDSDMQKGEFVVLVKGANAILEQASVEVEAATVLQILLEEELSVNQAAKIAARITGQAKNKLYRQAMELSQLRC